MIDSKTCEKPSLILNIPCIIQNLLLRFIDPDFLYMYLKQKLYLMLTTVMRGHTRYFLIHMDKHSPTTLPATRLPANCSVSLCVARSRLTLVDISNGSIIVRGPPPDPADISSTLNVLKYKALNHHNIKPSHHCFQVYGLWSFKILVFINHQSWPYFFICNDSMKMF